MSGSSAGEDRRATEILRSSTYHQRFLEHTRRTRGREMASAALATEWRYLGALIRPGEPPRVLDLACGSGAFALAWAGRGARVVGMDFDLDLLAAARSHGRELAQTPSSSMDWSCGDATRLPLRNGVFDVVFCNSLLEHVPDWRSVLTEVSRVLREGGVAVVYTTNRHCPLQQEVNHFPFYSWLPDPVRRRALRWIMEHRRDLVNYTDFPAIHWFDFPGLRRAFESVALEPLDRIDLQASGHASGTRGALIRAMHRYPALKFPYYLGTISMALYGVKRGRNSPGSSADGHRGSHGQDVLTGAS